ncbi:MAG: hypothetical protein IPN74_17935 [Haliscomenobacter sp.]|nr:hypothetical protein [Haliscomenobacter sp.]
MAILRNARLGGCGIQCRNLHIPFHQRFGQEQREAITGIEKMPSLVMPGSA